MAMFIKGLNLREQNALTEAMLNSGERFDFSDLMDQLQINIRQAELVIKLRC